MATNYRNQMSDLLDACDRLTAETNRLARALHEGALLTDRAHLNMIAQTDQLDAALDQARTNAQPA